jgi:UDP-glucose:(heptosyl)LPS alpha-1,3-glucosyltransferase
MVRVCVGSLVRINACASLTVTSTPHKPRIAVVSPFIDKRHGTERRLAEWISQLAGSFEIHIYSQRVEDIEPSKFTLRRIPRLPGPHIGNFIWWFVANRLWREWDHHAHGLKYDLVFSPGPNCFDADAYSVHIVFAEYVRKIAAEPGHPRQTASSLLRSIHQRLYYRLIVHLEKRAYTHPGVTLILIAKRTFLALQEHYGRYDSCPVIYVGLDHDAFNPERRSALREKARKELGLVEDQFVLLLIGNDWRNKGVPVILDALAMLRELNIDLLVVSSESPELLYASITIKSLDDCVRVLPPRKDVEFYYAAADAYVGPSVEDTFAQPPAEAMACGLPTIVSSENGTCEIITDGVDGLILRDPRDAVSLAQMIRRLYQDQAYRTSLGRKAAETAEQFTWERNGRELAAIFSDIIARNTRPSGDTQTQEL